MSRLFGTDGVRGVANQKLTPELALDLGRAAGDLLGQKGLPLRALIGLDTRQSGDMLRAAFSAGLMSSGVEVVDLGVVPTGVVSFLLRDGQYGLGVVVSASHNPAPDNGIKLLAADGRKLAEQDEVWIENHRGEPQADRPVGSLVGRMRPGEAEIERYMGMLLSIVPEGLTGLKVAVDGAHGAAHLLGPEMIRLLGAEVVTVGTSPTGMNINAEGGATKPQIIQDFTVQSSAHIGLSFDGDADRVVFSDDQGRLINGDRTMAIWCAHWAQHGGLEPPVVVGTVMSNGGFEAYMESQGVRLVRTSVGDKYVSKQMRDLGARIGGEQSGHLIFSERGVTGDGLITALELLRVLVLSGRKSSELFDSYEAWPQVLVNVTVSSKESLAAAQRFPEVLARAEDRLGERGRVNVRPSGTQPMLRVMVEADDAALRDEITEELVAALREEVGGEIYSRVDLTHSLGE
ncbi:MAG: phosphoglucosamine mutase [Fimbriimonadaceae bacterium]|nr:phosphoglucosamine mutase [Fimbriimonadaceae bacterium]